jgi:hypothetical protein
LDGGQDAAWVDQIILPANATVVSVNRPAVPNPSTCYPNPATDLVAVAASSTPSRIEVRDARGRIVFARTFPAHAARTWSVADWAPGIYVVTGAGTPVKLVVR